MGGNIVLNIIRTTFAALIAVFLLILVGQRNQIEERMRAILDSQDEQTTRDEKAARETKALRKTVNQLDKRLKSLDKTIRAGGIAVRPGNGGNVSVPVDEELDPRTLPHWPNEDNILRDLSQEPRAPEDAPEGGTINFYVGSNLRSLNPYVDSDVDQSDRVGAYVYSKLADQSMADPSNWVPALANRVTMSEDKREFTVYLRKGMMWHPPQLTPQERRGDFKWLAALPEQEVTAHDVKFTFDIVRNPLSECSNLASYFQGFEGIDVIDRYTIRVRWADTIYYNLSTTLGLLEILPRHIFGRGVDGAELDPDSAAQQLQQHWYNRRMCGNGPMRFVEFVDNSYIRLERNDDYWGDKPKFDALVLKIVVDAEMRLSLFKTGEIDLFNAQPGQWRSEYLEGGDKSLKAMEADDEITLHRVKGFSYRYIGWNQKREIFRDRALRRALAHCFPKERVCRDVYYGLSEPHDGPEHPDLPYYVTDLETFPFDPPRAAELLEEAGWKLNAQGVREKVIDGEKKELRFKILLPNTSPPYRDFSLIYKKELAKVGVILELDLREWQKMLTQLQNKDFDACSLGWGLSYDSDPSQIWHPREAEKPRSSNHVAYVNQELAEVIEGLRREFDPEKRVELQHRFQRIIVGDQPYLFLTVPTEAWFVNNRLGNQRFNKLRPQQWLLPWFVKEPE
ncbi:MAG: ABC transporter substrate-binding protein [Planctomycetota bacterium]|jgi:ABC-type transport system substrate-binding protein